MVKAAGSYLVFPIDANLTFQTSPSLRMQELTVKDIRLYIDGRVETSVALKELRGLYPHRIRDLLTGIEERAEGVFLWVVLVVEQLLIVVQNDPRL